MESQTESMDLAVNQCVARPLLEYRFYMQCRTVFLGAIMAQAKAELKNPGF
jgi:hypothetical protein